MQVLEGGVKKEQSDKDEKPLEEKKIAPFERVLISRNPARPKSKDYIENLSDAFVELHGDREFRDDPSIIGGLAYIGGEKFVVIGQEKGSDTESRLKRNFGMPYPEGYRKALRLMQLGEKFNIPVITFIDTPGAYPGLEAEERGQGWAIAKNLFTMANLSVPIICVLIGEGCSGGALGIGVGDTIAMLEHAYYSVISPEGCASILWKDAKMNAHAAAALKMHPEELLQFGIIDEIIPEPEGGAHNNPAMVYALVKQFILKERSRLVLLSRDLLLQKRYDKFRKTKVPSFREKVDQ